MGFVKIRLMNASLLFSMTSVRDSSLRVRHSLLKLILVTGAIISLASCGGGGNDEASNPPTNSVTASTGVFLDSPVAGLHYATQTFSGTTNSGGEFEYLPGETIKFSIGGIVLGSAKAEPVMTPLSLVPGATDPTDPVVTNIVRLLLTLDDDGNPDNGIVISVATSVAASGLSVDFSTVDLTTEVDIITLLAGLPGTPILVDATLAQTHFSATLAAQSAWGSMHWGSGHWRSASQ